MKSQKLNTTKMFHTDYFQRENFSIYGTWFWIVSTFSTACGLSSELFLLVCMWSLLRALSTCSVPPLPLSCTFYSSSLSSSFAHFISAFSSTSPLSNVEMLHKLCVIWSGCPERLPKWQALPPSLLSWKGVWLCMLVCVQIESSWTWMQISGINVSLSFLSLPLLPPFSSPLLSSPLLSSPLLSSPLLSSLFPLPVSLPFCPMDMNALSPPLFVLYPSSFPSHLFHLPLSSPFSSFSLFSLLFFPLSLLLPSLLVRR